MIHWVCKKYYESSEYQLNERKIMNYLDQKNDISSKIILSNTMNNSDIIILKNDSSLIIQNEKDLKINNSSNTINPINLNNSNIIENKVDKSIVNQNSNNNTNSTNSQNTSLESESKELKNENDNINFNNNTNSTTNSINDSTSNTENFNNSTSNHNNTSTYNQTNNTINTSNNTYNADINSTSSTITVNYTSSTNTTFENDQKNQKTIIKGVINKRNLEYYSNTYRLQISVPKFNNNLNEIENPIKEYKYLILDNLISIPDDLINKKILIYMDSLEFIDNTSLFRENYIKTNYLQYGTHEFTQLNDKEKGLIPDLIIQLEKPKLKTIITRSITTLIQGISEIFITIQLVFLVVNFVRNLFNSYCLDLFFVDENFKFDNSDENNDGNNKKHNKSPENEKKNLTKSIKTL